MSCKSSCSQQEAKSLALLLHSITQTLTTHVYSHPYEHTYANPTPISIFEDWADKFSRLTKSPQTPHCRRKYHLLLNAQRRWISKYSLPWKVKPRTSNTIEAHITTRLRALLYTSFVFGRHELIVAEIPGTTDRRNEFPRFHSKVAFPERGRRGVPNLRWLCTK